MKLKPDWLNQLAASARQAPAAPPVPLSRTQARVLGTLREAPSPGTMRWKPALALAAACVLIAIASLLRHRDAPLPSVSEAALADLESAEWTAPSDALLADAGPSAEADLRRQINQLLNSR